MLLACFNACLLLAAVAWLWRSTTAAQQPPVVPGLPILGNVIALGRGGVAFISQCREKFGDVFCLRLLGQRMVFVFDPRLLTLFFKAPDSVISFKPAVKQFTQRVYGLPSSEFFARHEPLLATLRGLLVPAELGKMGQQLLELAQPQLQRWQQQGKVELWAECKLLVFSSAGQVLFGKAFFERHGLERVFQAFMTFEENFEVAASPVPHLLLPAFRRSRRQLLSMFESSLTAGDFTGTVVAQLLEGSGMPRRLLPNLLLAVMWASQANSMPALFWSISMLTLPQQEATRGKVMEELAAAVLRQQQQPTGGGQPAEPPRAIGGIDAATAAAMIELAMDKRSCVSRCVAEAVRLRVHSIAVRFVATRTLVLQANSSSGDQQQQQQPEMRVPRGTILAICPIESHHDGRLYPEEPARFNPDRPGVEGLEPGTVVPGIAGMGFGGGFWRCPGRFFAEMELALLVQLVLLQLQLTPHSTTAAAGNAAADAADADAASGKCSNGGQHVAKGISRAQPAGKLEGCSRSSVSWLPAWLPDGFRRWAADVAVYGLGAGGCRHQVEQWGLSGDPQQLLPRANLLRLVGFKVPAEAWWVKVAAAAWP